VTRIVPFGLALLAAGVLSVAAAAPPAAPDLILHHGKVVTVDERFSVRQAIAVRDGYIVATGGNREILRLKSAATQLIDLGGKVVIPGLIDSHTHPGDASMVELDHEIPAMSTIEDVLGYVRSRAKVEPPGEWIQVRQVFITRLREQRYPTRDELDRAAPEHPVIFSTGPDASLNSLALKLSGIGRDFRPPDGGPGKVELDPATGEPTGILRSLTRYVNVRPTGDRPTEEDRTRRLLELFRDYNANGITSIGDRDASADQVERYRKLRSDGRLTVRVSISQHVDTVGPLEPIREKIRAIAADPLRRPDPFAQIIGIKTYLDGGMLTGSAYMREPWGVSKVYSITDPTYRGLRFIPQDRLVELVRTTVKSGLQYTAHSVGDGAVHALLDAYAEVDRTLPIRGTRPCITHSNFMSREAVERMPALGVSIDVQPIWLYMDARTLVPHFGYDRLRYFQPLHSIFAAGGTAGGGSDHMQKIGALRAVNPYHPFLGMWIAVARRARDLEAPLHPEEALTREQALRLYTRNNAYILFRDDVGSLEPGKRADLAVLDRDILTCPVDAIRDTRVLATYLGGREVYRRQ
jgi:predicted amidohydrolase YtcJ